MKECLTTKTGNVTPNEILTSEFAFSSGPTDFAHEGKLSWPLHMASEKHVHILIPMQLWSGGKGNQQRRLSKLYFAGRLLCDEDVQLQPTVLESKAAWRYI